MTTAFSFFLFLFSLKLPLIFLVMLVSPKPHIGMNAIRLSLVIIWGPWHTNLETLICFLSDCLLFTLFEGILSLACGVEFRKKGGEK